MRILICGDRDWKLFGPIMRELRARRKDVTVVIHGCARGADTVAGKVAYSLGIKVERYPADWTKYGKGAGPIRNQQMLDDGKPDLVLAFHEDIASSKGTADMVRRAKEAGIPVEIFTQ